jgi:hypothetical protein
MFFDTAGNISGNAGVKRSILAFDYVKKPGHRARGKICGPDIPKIELNFNQKLVIFFSPRRMRGTCLSPQEAAYPPIRYGGVHNEITNNAPRPGGRSRSSRSTAQPAWAQASCYIKDIQKLREVNPTGFL